DGQVIRITIPTLTEDRRKQMVKIVHSTTEDSKVAVRNIRRDALHQTKEQGVSEDEERRASQEMDNLTKRFVDEADRIGKTKEQEVLEV
ncbi:MAG: ribosome recycling factor, partial [Chloroflexota bacterium]|nr:ribosome recycling factor [Chloroflexota bacterium]